AWWRKPQESGLLSPHSPLPCRPNGPAREREAGERKTGARSTIPGAHATRLRRVLPAPRAGTNRRASSRSRRLRQPTTPRCTIRLFGVRQLANPTLLIAEFDDGVTTLSPVEAKPRDFILIRKINFGIPLLIEAHPNAHGPTFVHHVDVRSTLVA